MRLKSDIWVQSYIRILNSDNIPATIAQKGEASAGTIYIVCLLLDSSAKLFSPAPSSIHLDTSERYWKPYNKGHPAPEQQINDYLAKQLKFDPDLWVIEIEDPKGRSFLGPFLQEISTDSNPLDKLFKS